MIPKKIHYCWFGGKEKPRLAQKCIASWKRLCPDYEIIEWNENNFDLDYNGYTRFCYERRKWAFLSDLARLAVVAEHGGIYFDTDVELVKRPDALLSAEAFYGFENDKYVATGLGFGAQAHHPTVEAMLRQYDRLVPGEDGVYPMTACPRLNTAALLPFGLKQDGSAQLVGGARILPADFLNPYDDPTGRLLKTDNTVAIHWYAKSWMSRWTVLRTRIIKPLHRIFGAHAFERFRK